MITRSEFEKIDDEIKIALESTLIELKDSNHGDYVLLLANGEYRKEYAVMSNGINPHVIDYRMDGYKDESRLKFLTEFLTTFYSFPRSMQSTDDSEQRMHMELMIYCHIWEAQPFLKKLFRLASLANGEQYVWDVAVPEMGKHNFIRNDIRKKFNEHGSPLFSIVKQGFHTSLRNAFAHSEYFFDTMNQKKENNTYERKSRKLGAYRDLFR